MSIALEERTSAEAGAGKGNGGVAARRAMVRWAWRLFRREWRQQLLILALVVVAVAATIVGATVAIDARAPADFGFGTAHDMADFQNVDRGTATQIASLERRFGTVELIENQTLPIPGTVDTYDLRAQDPHGPYGGPMLDLLSGRYPAGPGDVAVTDGVASAFHLRVGDTWRVDSVSRRVVGIVQNPQSLLDEFALVMPGQVSAPTQITALFDAPRLIATGNISTPASVAQHNPLNPETIVLALATVGMLLIALVAVGGFTVLAQRRLRSIGMIESLGATDGNVRLVVRANGVVVGIVGALLGAALGLVVWLAYRPHAQASSHHLIGVWAVPWLVVVVAVVLAVVATYVAASRPARSITKVPVVTALSGRPAPPKRVHRSAVPGIVALVASFFLMGAAGADSNGGGAPELVFGLVAMIVAIILLAPLSLAPLARAVRRAPISVRLAVRDLARYRSRSGSALAAISLGVLIAVIICVVAAARYGNVLDWAGPNLASNQLIVYTPNGPGGGPGPQGGGGPGGSVPQPSLSAMTKSVASIASGLGARDTIELDSVDANLNHNGSGRQFTGAFYVATPQLLRAFGISAADVEPSADVLSMRPGLDGVSDMQLLYGNGGATTKIGPGQGPGPNATGGSGPGTGASSCPKGSCLANPVIEEVSALPAGTSAPNTVITEHAVRQFGLQTGPSGWLIQTAQPLTATQINGAEQTAAAAGMSVESKNDQPSSAEIIDWATVFGFFLALGILAMSVGLIRSETASNLRILGATGASSSTRRALTAATACTLGLLGAVVGTVGGYLATIGFLRSNANDGLSSLTNIPGKNLLIILVGMPLVAWVGGWLLAGREPAAMTQQPLE